MKRKKVIFSYFYSLGLDVVDGLLLTGVKKNGLNLDSGSAAEHNFVKRPTIHSRTTKTPLTGR
jgi:hypothetical protein